MILQPSGPSAACTSSPMGKKFPARIFVLCVPIYLESVKVVFVFSRPLASRSLF
jgi:hypothetical protein